MAFKLAKNFSAWLILVLCACACASNAASRAYDIPSTTQKFEEWMSRHGRHYKDVAEKAKRLKIFAENLRFVEEFNRAANRSYTVGLNHFSDLTNDEFAAAHTGFEGSGGIPDSVDWVKKGSDWAFSVVAAVEAITQQLIDCATDGNRGCQGGWMDNGFEYIINESFLTRCIKSLSERFMAWSTRVLVG
ncbi:hypothetical protein BT93_F2980 [Corymbia citriodora subsp. variegata]|nr:hypothetical protein BT93_F2980 [Corymbia citriodora subsp. variegata]